MAENTIKTDKKTLLNHTSPAYLDDKVSGLRVSGCDLWEVQTKAGNEIRKFHSPVQSDGLAVSAI